MAKVKVSCIKCPKCGDIIYSRAHHDWRNCSCGAVFIDGGDAYTRIGWNPEIGETPKVFNKFIMNATRKDLYDDWNNKKDNYGIIKCN